MAAPYVKRYAGGFVDLPSQTTPVDSQFLNAVETALLHLLGEAPSADEVGVWSAAGGGGLVYQKITNAQIAAGAAIDKSKLAALNITDADIAAAAGIAKSKLGPLNIADADIQAAAAIAISKLAGYPADATKTLRGDGTWDSESYALIRHSAAVGTNGGSLTATTWVTRPITAEILDTKGLLTITANQIRLVAGVYRVRIVANGFHGAGRVATRLRNVDANTTLLVGTTSYAVDSAWESEIIGQITVNGTDDLEIQHWSSANQATNGMGLDSTGGGEDNVYMLGEFWKVG